MTQRTRIIPVERMALRLARRPAQDRAGTGAAIAALEAEDEFALEDIVAGIDRARARAAQLVVAAASDAPWAAGLGQIRDALAFGVLAGFVVYGWLIVP